MYYVIDSFNQGFYVKMAKIKSCDYGTGVSPYMWWWLFEGRGELGR
jgi:hypothetical protein